MLTNAILAALAETDPIARLDCEALRLPHLHGGVFKGRTSTARPAAGYGSPRPRSGARAAVSRSRKLAPTPAASRAFR